MKTITRTMRLDAAVTEAKQQAKGKTAGVDKKFTALKTTVKDGSTAATGGFDISSMEPTSEQLAKVNEFTRTPKQAHEVVVFPTLSCNDMIDRDDEKFDTKTVQDFASLEQPYSPIGKSYMVGHDYKQLPVGRIFDAEAANIDGTEWLKNWIYIPNTDANKSFIENIDFGVNWAVSVGVMIEESVCGLSFCGAPMYGFFGMSFCSNGHDKSYHYTKDAEEDSWGYPLPCEPGTAGAEKCIGIMRGAKDFYELSQVFLGAQFFAALDKTPGLKSVMKAATKGVPILGLSAKEAEELPLPHMDPRARDALRRFSASFEDEETMKWKDDQSLVWNYDMTKGEIVCLGKSADDEDEDDATSSDVEDEEVEQDGTAQAESDGEPHGSDEGLDASAGSESSEHVTEGDDSEDGRLGTDEVEEGLGQDGSVTDESDEDSEDGNNDDEKEASVSKAAIVKALTSLRAPAVLLDAAKDASGDSLDAALSAIIKAHDTKVGELTSKATLGAEYIKVLRADAIDWYTRANSTEGKGVNVDLFTKMLDQCGDNADLIMGLRDMQKSTAQAKFPTSVRRSSFPTDANTAEGVSVPDLPEDDRTAKSVKRLHG